MKTGDIFPRVDWASVGERDRLGLKIMDSQRGGAVGAGRRALLFHEAQGVMAEYTGEKRPPRQGEWYLSGAIIGAYRAEHDLDTPYHIARLVRVETVTTQRVIARL